jgi:hypothetical protein
MSLDTPHYRDILTLTFFFVPGLEHFMNLPSTQRNRSIYEERPDVPILLEIERVAEDVDVDAIHTLNVRTWTSFLNTDYVSSLHKFAFNRFCRKQLDARQYVLVVLVDSLVSLKESPNAIFHQHPNLVLLPLQEILDKQGSFYQQLTASGTPFNIYKHFNEWKQDFLSYAKNQTETTSKFMNVYIQHGAGFDHQVCEHNGIVIAEQDLNELSQVQYYLRRRLTGELGHTSFARSKSNMDAWIKQGIEHLDPTRTKGICIRFLSVLVPWAHMTRAYRAQLLSILLSDPTLKGMNMLTANLHDVGLVMEMAICIVIPGEGVCYVVTDQQEYESAERGEWMRENIEQMCSDYEITSVFKGHLPEASVVETPST